MPIYNRKEGFSQNNRKTGFRFSPPPRARKPCAAPLSLSFSAHHLRSARSVVLGFVMYGAFCECNQYVLPLFGKFFRHATHRQPCALAHRPIPSAHLLHPRCPVSATPTAFAPQIGQFPLSRRRRPRLLRKSVNSPLEKAGKNPCFRQRVYWIHARPSFFSGRADNACANLLGFFVRYVRTRGIAEVAESGKIADFRFILCRTRLPRTARATNSCTRRAFFKREESPLK